jgi:hypothetical protein
MMDSQANWDKLTGLPSPASLSFGHLSRSVVAGVNAPFTFHANFPVEGSGLDVLLSKL